MSEGSVAPAPVAPEAGGGFFQNIVDLYFSPREAFARIVKGEGQVFVKSSLTPADVQADGNR